MADFDFNKPVYKTPRRYKTFIDLTGQQFSRLSVLGYVGRDPQNLGIWHVRCECGTEKVVRSSDLRKGIIVSCGCFMAETTARTMTKHGRSRDKEYKIYYGAKDRCQNPRNKGYFKYGGRGIEFRFTSFEQFMEAIGPRPSLSHSVDRKDNDGHYEPGNVRWATPTEQALNTRRNKPG